MSTPQPAIEAEGLVKAFGQTRAVDGVDLVVPVGSVYGVLGPNGAGKTTTVRMLATLLRPDAGSARVMGFDVRRDAGEVRRIIGLTGQYASVDEDITATENLILVGRLLGLSRADSRSRAAELLDAFGLSEAAGRRVKTFSGGMRRRIDLAASLVATPEVLFLDEPTTGLDPRSRTQVWGAIRELVAQGTTVLLTTQYLDEADQLADRIGVIDHGRVIADGTATQLKESVGRTTLHLRLSDDAEVPAAERAVAEVLGVEAHRSPEAALITAPVESADAAADVLLRLRELGIRVAEISVQRPSLDEVFLQLTGRPADDDSTDTTGTTRQEGDAA